FRRLIRVKSKPCGMPDLVRVLRPERHGLVVHRPLRAFLPRPPARRLLAADLYGFHAPDALERLLVLLRLLVRGLSLEDDQAQIGTRFRGEVLGLLPFAVLDAQLEPVA